MAHSGKGDVMPNSECMKVADHSTPNGAHHWARGNHGKNAGVGVMYAP